LRGPSHQLSRRELFLLSAAALRVSAQSPYPGTPYRDYSRCLPDYLRDIASAAYQRRNAEIAKLTSVEAIIARQRWVTGAFWRIVGGKPERTPLRARTVGSFERAGYRLDKVIYESRPELYVTANLYIPTAGKPPYPGVLFQMGHSLNGKAADSYQKCCQGLARLGYVVLAFDPMGQGERIYYPAGKGQTRLASADDEHTYPGKQMLLAGESATLFQVWDAIRSLDYLASHPQVDPARLASTGQSGGATVTMLLAAVDDRLAAAAVASGNTENFACANFNPPGSTDDAEQNLIGSGPLGLDRWDLLYPLAPKPLLVLVSDKDPFGTYSPQYLSSGWEEYQKLERVYGAMGAKEHLGWATTPLPHGLSYYFRVRIYNWFERWLKGSDRVIESEPPVEPEPDEKLWVGATGNAVHDFHSVTPFHLMRQHAGSSQTPSRPEHLEMLLGLERLAPAPTATVLARVPSRAIEIQAIEVPSAPRVWIPAWLFLPKNPDRNQRMILLLDEHGRNQHWREDGLGEKLASRGRIACAADLRGIGDLRPEAGRGSAGYEIPHASEEDYAWASLILGPSLLGQRVADVLALVQALKSQGKIAIAANGRLTIPTLFAAALSNDVESVYLSGGLVSFRAIVDSERYKQPLANFLPNVLAHTDLPQLAASIAPRPVHLSRPTGAAGEPLQLDAVHRIYPHSNIELSSEGGWNIERLLRL
jgi:dienelactone hydrolase